MKEFIFIKVAGLQPETDNMTKSELFYRHFQGFCQFSRNSYFQDDLLTATSAPFSNDFVANFKHAFASTVFLLIFLSYCFQKETN